ncbi:hypothetical protein HETIRDRAFT_106182 [Heterobasidion irregulare TC 32-1]|uniref:F-box domain-containing protein n=1 Tax=Heterobasidion irregulare (strain TC 32-1) TaxID=747525 RepID=W4JVB0_HETIT|nr:uncharacterized protein HETIRDRAFT_106182 [Heterobasidion irregulare TC 32-1]ETW76786.1 hypothetical protein HETIRDRAFT_106182 [Heterobasidion irregulare TC 32-1]
MDSLPYERLDAIVSKMHHFKDLLQIRTLNKTFCALATPRVFREVIVTKHFTSAAVFDEILQNDAIAQSIETITFREGGDHEYAHVQIRDTVPGPKSNLEISLKSLTSSFARIHDLPRLKNLVLSFYREPKLLLQSTILSAILSRPHPLSLSSLALDGLMSLHDSIYDLPSFKGLFGSLSSLMITTKFTGDPKSHSRNAYIRFWEQGIQHSVLGSLSHSLTSFILHSDVDVGIVPRLDFSQATFPVLEFLWLGRILFNAVTHVEDFILQLRLKTRRTKPRQWSHIWDYFAEELKALGTLKVESESHWFEDYSDSDLDDGEPMNYVQLKEGRQGTRYAYSAMEGSPYDDSDARALQKFWCLIHPEDEY